MNINKSVNNEEKVKSLVDEYNQWIEAVKWLRGHVKKFHVYVKKTIIPFCIQKSLERSKRIDYVERFIYLFNIFIAEYDFLTMGNKKLKMHIDETGYHHAMLLNEITKLSGKKFSDKKTEAILEAMGLRTQNWNIRSLFDDHVATLDLFVKAIKDILIFQSPLLLDLVEKTYIISYKMICDDAVTKIDNKRLSFPSRAKFREWFEKLVLVPIRKEITVETNSSSSSLTSLNKGAAAKERPTASRQSLEKEPVAPVTKHTTVVNDDDEIGASTSAHTAQAVKKRTIGAHDDDNEEASSGDSKRFSGKYFVFSCHFPAIFYSR